MPEDDVSDVPAWLQGISAVVALGLSAWAITGQALAKRKEGTRRAQALAVSIFPDILFIQVSLGRAEKVISQQPFAEHAERQQQSSPNPQGVVAGQLRQAIIPVPPMIDRLAEDMWRLGDGVGVSAAQMVSLLYQWNALVEKAAARIAEGGAQDISAVVQALSGNIAALKSATEETERGVAKIHP